MRTRGKAESHSNLKGIDQIGKILSYHALKHKAFKKPWGNSFQKWSTVISYKMEHVEAYIEQLTDKDQSPHFQLGNLDSK